MIQKKRSPLYEWQREMVAAFHDYRWRQVLEPLYEKFRQWKAGEISHKEEQRA